MNKETDIKEKLKYVSLMEGDVFEYDEVGIEHEYSKLDSDQSSLAIKILTIAGGFFATLAFLGFLFIAGLQDSKLGLVIIGFMCVGCAIWLNVKFEKLIIDTMSISAYAIGFCLLAYGLGEFNVGENLTDILFICISLISLRITQSYIISFISILIINGSILFLIVHNHYYSFIHLYNALVLLLMTYVFLNEAKLITYGKRISKLYNPVRIGLIFSLVTGLVFVGKRGLFDYSIDNVWVSSLITIPLSIYIISLIIKIVEVTEIRNKLIIYVLSFLVLIPTTFSPAITGALVIVLLSFLVNYKTGLAVGVISFIYFISQFYYDLNYTLLTKSILLFSSGIIFLLFYFFTHKKISTNEKI